MYSASQTIVLYMKRLDKTEFPIFVCLCVLRFQRQPFRLLFILYFLHCCYKVWIPDNKVRLVSTLQATYWYICMVTEKKTYYSDIINQRL